MRWHHWVSDGLTTSAALISLQLYPIDFVLLSQWLLKGLSVLRYFVKTA